MKRAIKTDNSHFEKKVILRLQAIKSLDKQEINILDCFAGKGLLWKEVQKRTHKTLHIVGIEKEKGKNPNALCGDNLKILPTIPLETFDIIDLEAYGIPDKQLKIIFDKKYNGTIIVTAISSMYGQISNLLLENSSLKKEFYKKAPTLFINEMFGLLINFLYLYKCKKIKGYFLHKERKYYFMFNI